MFSSWYYESPKLTDLYSTEWALCMQIFKKSFRKIPRTEYQYAKHCELYIYIYINKSHQEIAGELLAHPQCDLHRSVNKEGGSSWPVSVLKLSASALKQNSALWWGPSKPVKGRPWWPGLHTRGRPDPHSFASWPGVQHWSPHLEPRGFLMIWD